MWIIHSTAKFGRYKFICFLIGERTTGLQISLKPQYTYTVFRVDYSKKIFRRCSNIWSFLISCKVDLSKDIFPRCSNILSYIFFLQRKLQLLFVYIYCSQVFFIKAFGVKNTNISIATKAFYFLFGVGSSIISRWRLIVKDSQCF